MNEEKLSKRKVVVALRSYKSNKKGFLSLEKGHKYEVLDDTDGHWWKVNNLKGSIGYIPRNYVKKVTLHGLHKYTWFVGDMSPDETKSLLSKMCKEGCFVVRKSTSGDLYSLSYYTKKSHSNVVHNHIKQNHHGEYYISRDHCYTSVSDLIHYHRRHQGGLHTRLKCSPFDRPATDTIKVAQDKWEIDIRELQFQKKLGEGSFGIVHKGKLMGMMDVAIKTMKAGAMSGSDFIREAKVMKKLRHRNVVELYGVCSSTNPISIVTEYLCHGSLLLYLIKHKSEFQGDTEILMDFCLQICRGMAYLERKDFIHRDLAARNCLVGPGNIVKVADFGLSRYAPNDFYFTSSHGVFPPRWVPPEVFTRREFSSKSDIWAFGVLMWEIFTCGKCPYQGLTEDQVKEKVKKGWILPQPQYCQQEVYEVMKMCWLYHPQDRPSFRSLKEYLLDKAERLPVLMDCQAVGNLPGFAIDPYGQVLHPLLPIILQDGLVVDTSFLVQNMAGLHF